MCVRNSAAALITESEIRSGKNGVNTWRVQTACQLEGCFCERTLRIGRIPVRVGVDDDQAHTGTFGREGDRSIKICCPFGTGCTLSRRLDPRNGFPHPLFGLTAGGSLSKWIAAG